MKNLSPARHILGMKISRPRNRTQFFLSQANYIERALEHFNMESTKFAFIPLLSSLWLSQKNCSTSSPKGEIIKSVPYAPTINSLVYTTVATRLDLAHAIRVISRFMHNFDQLHWNVVKHMCGYLMGAKDYDILFRLNETSSVVGYIDSNFAGCLDSRKSTTGYCFKFSNGAISWKSKLQECTTTLTTEVEYIPMSCMP